MKLTEFDSNVIEFVEPTKKNDNGILFWYLQNNVLKKEIQLTFEANFIGTNPGFKKGQDVLLLEVTDAFTDVVGKIEEHFRSSKSYDPDVKTYDFVFNSEIKAKLQQTEKGDAYKERGNLTPASVLSLGYQSLLVVTASFGWYEKTVCEDGDGEGQGLFMKVRDIRTVSLKRTSRK